MEYLGSCHCKAIKYKFTIDKVIDEITTIICNCSYCYSVRFWEVRVFDKDNFKVYEGNDKLKLYQFGAKETYHYFCDICGVHTHGFSQFNKLGKPFYFINVPTIQGLSNEQLSSLKRKYIDGENEKWEDEPKYTNYL